MLINHYLKIANKTVNTTLPDQQMSQNITDYLRTNYVTPESIFNILKANIKNPPQYTFLLFNVYGIGTSVNLTEAFKAYILGANEEAILAEAYLAIAFTMGLGTTMG
ncbi:hypothetical protein G9A89_000170, partial [Geosiphon pyriformis]